MRKLNRISATRAGGLAAAMVLALTVAPHSAIAADPQRFVGRADISLAERVQRLEDIEEIHELMYAYGRAVDTKDFTALGQLFTAQGTWAGSGGGPAMVGPQAIHDGMEKIFGAKSGVIWNGDFHVFTNAIIELNGDTAAALSKWQFVSPDPKGGTKVDYAGHYEDSFVREGGHWKFQHRLVVNDIAAPRPAVPK